MSDCCQPASVDSKAPCPGCGHLGLPVGERTVAAIVRPEQHALSGRRARFCRTPECAVLYYASDGPGVVEKSLAQVRIGLKDPEDPSPLCYCFGFDRAAVRQEVAATGDSSIPARIAAEVKAGRCACDVRNPSGVCCLGDVNKAVRAAQANLELRPRRAS